MYVVLLGLKLIHIISLHLHYFRNHLMGLIDNFCILFLSLIFDNQYLNYFSGGPDAPPPFTNLIRVKKVFPSQPAWESRQFQEGDILISCAGHQLSGLGLRQALDILRSSPPITTLCVCRPKNPEFPINPYSYARELRNNKRIRSYRYLKKAVRRYSNFC